jgi:hypothetical protein
VSRFVLIDHSIADLGGHYYEYAVRVLEAAEDMGFEPVLAVNRQFSLPREHAWRIYPVYQHRLWGDARGGRLTGTLKRVLAPVRKWIFLRKASLTYSPLSLWWSERHLPLAETLSRFQARGGSRLTLLALLGACYLFRVMRAGRDLLRALVPFRTYFKGVVQGLRRFLAAVFAPVLLAVRGRDLLKVLRTNVVKPRSFARDTWRLFREVPLEPGDVVFIPTLGEAEMQGLRRFFKRYVRSQHAHWHLVFRRNLYLGRDADYAAQDEGLRPTRNTFRAFCEGLGGQQVYLYTDTEALTAQYNRLGVAAFRTLPIPVSPGYLLPRTERHPEAPCRVIYGGDARTEKGYHHLPRLVRDLWDEYVEPGKVTFAFQSNFNVPGGEPQVATARVQLQAYPADKVRLLLDPLTTREYRHLVLGGDIVLILYDRDNYYARSSGILVEALTAGIPVVVPAWTWMSVQLAEVIHAYHQDVRRSVSVLKSHTNMQLRWRLHGTPDLNPFTDGQMTLSGSAPRYCWSVPPPGATHLLVTFRHGGDSAGEFTRLHVDQLNDERSSIAQESHLLGGGKTGASALVQLDLRAKKIWAGFRNASPASCTRITDIRFDFCRAAGDVPLSAVGMIYHDPDMIAACVREIVDHEPHYRASARAFAARWAAYHNPRCLVQHLAGLADESQAKHCGAGMIGGSCPTTAITGGVKEAA